MDSREDEQLRGITMKSSAISLLFTKGNVYLHTMTVALQFMSIMLNRMSVPLSYKWASNLCADAMQFIAKGSLCAVLLYVKKNWVLTKWQWRQQPKILALCKSIMSQITHFLSPQVNAWDSEWFAQFSSVILPFHFQDLTSGSPYCLPNSSYNVSLENLVMDQLIIPLLTFFFFLITCFLDIILMFRC